MPLYTDTIISARPIEAADTGAIDIASAAERFVAITMPEPGPEPVEEVPAWTTGIEGTPRSVSVGDNSGVLAIVSVIFIGMMLSYKHCRILLGQLMQSLWGMRSRDNLFNEHTSKETQVVWLMGAQWCVCTGLLLYSAINLVEPLPPARAFVHTGALIGLMAVYYLVQFAAYSTVGYVFTDSVGRRLYLQGFSASQLLLGFTLLIPALVSIFYPLSALPMVEIGAALYLTARMIFIIKGFRIFYTNFGSLLYFILYLCTLEIIPLLVVYSIGLFLVNNL